MSQTNNSAATGIPFNGAVANHGLLYDSQVMTFLAAKLENDSTVRDFDMITNPDNLDCFEDILLRVTYTNGRKVMYVVQIKHSKNRLQIAKTKKDGKQRCMTIDLTRYFKSFRHIRNLVTERKFHQGPLKNFLRSVEFENYYFCILTTISEPDEDTKLQKVDISSHTDLKLLNMENCENCYQLDRNVYISEEYENLCSEEFAKRFYILLDQPNYRNINVRLTEANEAVKHFTQPMTHDLYNLVTEHSFDPEEYLCNALNKEQFVQLSVQVILNNNLSIYTLKTKPIDKKYIKAWDEICSAHNIISINEHQTDVLMPLLAYYYEYRIRKFTKKALENVLRGDNNSMEDNISLKNYQFTWNDRQLSGFQLDDYLRRALKSMGIDVLNLRDLLLELWRRKEIPIIVERSIADIIIKLVGPNTKNRFFIVSNSDTTFKDGTGIFRNLLDLRDGPGSANLPEVMEIEVSLQGRPPVPLQHIIRENLRTLQLVTSSELLHWIAEDSQGRKIGLPLKETVENYVTRKFHNPIKNVDITEDDIVRGLNSSNLTIISNDPGMGKTTVLTSLARRCHPARYVIIHDLAQCKIDLQDSTSDIHTDPIRYVYNKTQTKENSLVEGILEQHIDEKNLVIFLDSFDEILPLHQGTVLEVVGKMLAMDAHVFVTSRTQTEHLLMSKFGNVVSNYVNLTYLDSKDISDFFERCQVPKHIWAKLPETFVSTPLHLQMFYEIYKTGTEENAERINETMLYKTFIDNKIQIYYEKKNIYENHTHEALSLAVVDILNKHYIIALVFLFGLERIESLQIVTKKQWDEMLRTFDEYKLSLAILSTVSPIKFIHKTFAEYLAAVYINTNPDKCIELYKEFVTNIDFFQTYKFLHDMRSLDVTEETIIASISDGQEKDILDIISASDTGNKLYKTWGMHPIHWAAVCCFMKIKSKMVDSKSVEILRIILQQTCINETDNASYDVDLKDKYVDWNWLNFLTGQSSNNYDYFKHLILCLQTNTNEYLKSRIEENIDMQYTDSDGYSLSELAVINSDKEVFTYLVNRGSELDYSRRDKHGRNTLHHACFSGNQEIVNLIIDSKSATEFINAHDNNGWDALHYACKKGNQELVECLLRRGFDVNKKSNNGETPFHLACQINATNLVQYMIKQNADVNATFGEEEQSVLQEACFRGNLDIVKLLLAEKRCEHTQGDRRGSRALHYAAKRGNVQIMGALVEMGMNPNQLNSHEETPLHYACAQRHFEAVKHLLDEGANPQLIDKYGRNCLHFACGVKESGAKDIVDLLIHKNLKLDIKDQDHNGWDALHYACHNGNRGIAENLLTLGFDVNKTSKIGETPFHLACGANDFNLVISLIENGANIKATSREKTALHFAAEGENIEILKALINKGLKADAKNDEKQTPLHLACGKGHHEAVILLLDKGANPLALAQDGNNALHFACLGGKSSIVDLLLNSKNTVDINQEGYRCRTPLHYAVEKGNVDMVNKLLARGANPNATDKNLKTPLHLVCEKRHFEIVNILIEANADVHIRDEIGQTPLHYAAVEGNVDVVNTLLARKANLKATDKRLMTPLDLACERRHFEIVKILMKASRFHINDKYDQTPLHYAVVKGNVDVVNQLLERGANPNATNKPDLQTPLHLACEKGHFEIVKILMEAKADAKHKDSSDNDALTYAKRSNNMKLIKFLQDKLPNVEEAGKPRQISS